MPSCHTCSLALTKDENVQCAGLCGRFFHPGSKCTGYTKETCKLLTRTEGGLKYFCADCKDVDLSTIATMINSQSARMKILFDNSQRQDETLTQIRADLTSLRTGDIDNLTSYIDDADKRRDKFEAELLRRQDKLERSHDDGQQDLKRLVVEQFEESMTPLRRDMRTVLRGVPTFDYFADMKSDLLARMNAIADQMSLTLREISNLPRSSDNVSVDVIHDIVENCLTAQRDTLTQVKDSMEILSLQCGTLNESVFERSTVSQFNKSLEWEMADVNERLLERPNRDFAKRTPVNDDSWDSYMLNRLEQMYNDTDVLLNMPSLEEYPAQEVGLLTQSAQSTTGSRKTARRKQKKNVTFSDNVPQKKKTPPNAPHVPSGSGPTADVPKVSGQPTGPTSSSRQPPKPAASRQPPKPAAFPAIQSGNFTRWLKVAGLRNDTTVPQLQNHLLRTINCSDVQCNPLYKKGTDCRRMPWVSFKIGVPQEFFEAAMNKRVWPVRCTVSEFIEEANFRTGLHRQQQRRK